MSIAGKGLAWIADFIDVIRAGFENAEQQVANQLHAMWMDFQPAATVGIRQTTVRMRLTFF